MRGNAPYRLFAGSVGVVAVLVIGMPVIAMLLSVLWQDGGFPASAWRGLFSGAEGWSFYGNTLMVAGLSAAAALALGFPVGLVLGYFRVPCHSILFILLMLPLTVPAYVAAVAWVDVLGQNGLLARTTGWTVPNIYTPWGATFVFVLSYTPIVMLATMVAARRLSQPLEDAARLAASPWRVWTAVLIPLLLPTALAAACLVFMLALANFSVPSLLQVSVYPVAIHAQFEAFYDFPGALVKSLPLVTLGFLVALLARYSHTRQQPWLAHQAQTAPHPRGTRLLRGTTSAMLLLYALFAAGVPCATLLWRAWPLDALGTSLISAVPEIKDSLTIAGVSVLVTVPLAFGLAHLPRKHSLVLLLTLLPFLMSGPALGIALIAVWNRSATALVYDSPLIVVLACVARSVGFATLILAAGLKRLAPSLDDAAALAGVGRLRRLWRIALPLTLPYCMAAGVLTFVLTLTEIGASVLVIPPGTALLPLRLFSLMHYGASRMTATLSLIMMLVIMTAALVAFFTGRLFWRRTHGNA